MEHYDLEVCGLKRELPFVKLSDGTAYASFVVISDTELIEKAGKELAAFANGAEIILTIEAKGIALAYEISKQLHMKEFVVVRKSVKSYVKSFIQDAVHSITTEGNQDIFLDETDAEKLKGKKVAIVDDVISKGESLAAAERLVQKAGGEVCSRLAILAEGKAAERTDITFLQKLPLFQKGKNPMSLLIKNVAIADVLEDEIKPGIFISEMVVLRKLQSILMPVKQKKRSILR